ncbi:MAG: ATP-binding protein [Nitrospirae bacterium]|nr:ATP-binding protein [Nitrospirota bacterium]
MLSKILSAALIGIDAHVVEVEVDITSRGLPHFSTVGLPDTAVKESKDRVRAALKNTGFNFPLKQITVNLAPADIKKEGSAFDLPIAIGITVAEGIIETRNVEGYIISGELSLDGRIKPVKGALSMAIAARDKKMKGLIMPAENAQEAAVVTGVPVYGFDSLPALIDFLRGTNNSQPTAINIDSAMRENSLYQDDFLDVKGQEHVKRALEVAAAGGHNVLIQPLLATRPFRSPHHTLSDAAMVGGGQVPKPGEVSLAHNGVLFLDELPEFKRNVLEVMRQPLEDGSVTISRAVSSITYPSSIMLVCAMNPCPCGYLGDIHHQCTCTPSQIHRYRHRVSGPLLDRIDIHVEVPAVPYKELSKDFCGESSEHIRRRVQRSREIQVERFKKDHLYSNAKMRSKHIKKYCTLKPDAQNILETAMQRLGLSARAYTRILKVSRTIADIAGSDQINAEHISEAIQYRTLDRGAL